MSTECIHDGNSVKTVKVPRMLTIFPLLLLPPPPWPLINTWGWEAYFLRVFKGLGSSIWPWGR